MRLSTLTVDEASQRSVSALGLDSDLIGITSTEGLAASLRRAASFMCPTSPRRLIDAVLGAVQPVCSDVSLTSDRLQKILNLLVGSGDLLELRHEAERSTRLLYLAPPSYIVREPGVYVLLGIRPFGAPLIDPELGFKVEREGQTRILRLDTTSAREKMRHAGLQKVEPDHWVGSPKKEEAGEILARIGKRLDAAASSGDIENLHVLDPATPVRYYRGRWRPPLPTDTGDFVARRPQTYGANLWCWVRLDSGQPKKMVEFPVDDFVVPARDEAWRLQMAIDGVRGTPQNFRVVQVRGIDAAVISFFSPIPGFAERHLQLIGMAMAEPRQALTAYRVPSGSIPALRAVLTDMLWMEQLEVETSR